MKEFIKNHLLKCTFNDRVYGVASFEKWFKCMSGSTHVSFQAIKCISQQVKDTEVVQRKFSDFIMLH